MGYLAYSHIVQSRISLFHKKNQPNKISSFEFGGDYIFAEYDGSTNKFLLDKSQWAMCFECKYFIAIVTKQQLEE